MLKNLLKYDLKWCYTPLIVFYILSIFVATLTRIFGLFDESFIFIILSKIFTGATIAMTINILINNFMRVWVRCIKNLYKDESYLTHTIPVSKDKIFLSKVLTAITTLLTSMLVIVATLAIAFLNKDSWEYIKNLVEGAGNYLDISILGILIIFIMVIFFEILFIIMSGIVGIILGYKSNNLKKLKSVIFGFLAYIIPATLMLVGLYVVGLFNSDFMEMFNSSSVSIELLKTIMYLAMVVYILFNVIHYVISVKVFKKGVNVD